MSPLHNINFTLNERIIIPFRAYCVCVTHHTKFTNEPFVLQTTNNIDNSKLQHSTVLKHYNIAQIS